MAVWTTDVQYEQCGSVGLITLNRARALNALSLPMIRELTHVLRLWQDDDAVQCVAIRGSRQDGPFGAFCAGGDIRYFHQAALSGDPTLEDFFTEEYALNYLIHTYPKPYIAFMDGIVMGGGMGLSQGAQLRIVTPHTQMAMPETQIGLFPDVGGGYFLSRCPGHVGEYLGLTGQLLNGLDAVSVGLADVHCASDQLAPLWQALTQLSPSEAAHAPAHIRQWIAQRSKHDSSPQSEHTASWWHPAIDAVFGLPDVSALVARLQTLSADLEDDWYEKTINVLRQKSPLMLHVTFAQIRRARSMRLADALRMERDLVRHCFDTRHLSRRGPSSETVEGIRALVIDKDKQPKWQPAKIEEVSESMVAGFLASPWPASQHPLVHLK